jgi:hypothetical protein
VGVKDYVTIKRADLEKRWRADLKQIGRETVRYRYINPPPVTDAMPYPEAEFVRKWLAQQDRNAKLLPVLVTVLTLLFAGIAAWPVIKGWMTPRPSVTHQ